VVKTIKSLVFNIFGRAPFFFFECVCVCVCQAQNSKFLFVLSTNYWYVLVYLYIGIHVYHMSLILWSGTHSLYDCDYCCQRLCPDLVIKGFKCLYNLSLIKDFLKYNILYMMNIKKQALSKCHRPRFTCLAPNTAEMHQISLVRCLFHIKSTFECFFLFI